MNPVVLLNTFNLTSAAGFLIAGASRCQVTRRGPYWEATGYRWRFPVAGAVTVGCVVISRRPLTERVWRHEVTHIRQYALLGPVFWPAYALAAGGSWLRTGDWWSRNVFERRAGLSAGGYVERPLKRFGRPTPGATAADAATA